METLFFSSGKAARELGVSQERIRDLCSAGAIPAESTPGGQFRISGGELERLKRDGLPPLARPMPGCAPRSAANPRYGTAALLAEPSNAVVTAAEQVAITEALLKRRKLERELAETEDWFRGRERDEAEQLAAEEREDRARLADEAARRERDESVQFWEAHALGLVPSDAPPEVRLTVHEAVREKLMALDPMPAPPVTRQIAEALVERLLAPWLREKEIEDVLIGCRDGKLPAEALGSGNELSQWQKRALRAAGDAIKQLRDDAPIEEIRAVGRRAAGGVAVEFEHQRMCEEIASRAWLSLRDETSEERQQSRELVAQALVQLPVGSSRKEMEATRDAAVQPIRDAIAQRQRKDQDRGNRAAVLDAAGWTVAFDFPADQKQAALKAVADAVAAIPVGAPLAQLKAARDRTIELFRNAHAQRRRKEQLIEGALREVFPSLLKLERDWDFEGKTAWGLAEEFKAPIRKVLAAQLTGEEPPEQVARLLHRLVRRQLSAAPEPAVA